MGAAVGPPEGLAFDSQGNLYIADTGNYMVLRVGRNGIITVVAGNGIPGYSGDDGPATSASMRPTRVAVDAQDNVYVADPTAGRIRKVSPDGIIRRFAGRPGGSSGEGQPALEAGLNPAGLAVDAAGLVFVVDLVNNRVRKIDTRGIVTTVAGNGMRGFSGDGGPALAASLASPYAVAVGPDGSLYIADSGNNRIRRVSADGLISTFAGNGEQGLSGLGGPAAMARISGPFNVVVDAAGNVYFSTSFNVLFQVDLQGMIRSIVGPGPTFSASYGLALGKDGNFYSSDPVNRRVRQIQRNGVISTFAGEGGFRANIEGAPAVESFLFEPHGITLDAAGNAYIADTGNNRVRRLAPGGTLTTIASITEPQSVILDRGGSVLISRIGGVWRLSSDGMLTRIAGGALLGFGGDGGPATQASLGCCLRIATDAAGNLFIADPQNNRVRRVGLDGIITTVAGNGTAVSSGDGGQAVNAGLRSPISVAVDSAGNLYIPDGGGIRKVSTTGVITTLANSGGPGGITDIAPDAGGTIYAAHGGQNRVLVVSQTGVVLSAIGSGEQGFRGDGGPPSAAALNSPSGVAVDAAGRIYIADTLNHRIRVVEIVRSTFQLSTRTLSFSARSNGLPPTAQSFDVTSPTVGLPFTVGAATGSGGPWLVATPTSGVTPARIRASMNPSGLAAGAYQGTITVTAPDAGPPTQTVTVQLTVEPAAPPVVAIEPTGLTFSFLHGASPATQQLRVFNAGSGSLAFSVTATTLTGGSWLSATPASGTATPSSPIALTITANPERLAPGTYSGRVTITPAGLDRQEVPVT
ncbi:MAG: hypothetical protein HY238_08495, partial [Acidobacteria bacterium]|nr:hypothetical protein [Acidobacteriota bacterium]